MPAPRWSREAPASGSKCQRRLTEASRVRPLLWTRSGDLPYQPARSSRPGTPPAMLRALAKRDAPTAAPLVTFPDSWHTRNLARRRADQDLKQLAHLQLLGEWVGQRERGPHLVAVPSALSLAHHVPLIDQLGQDSVGGAFGDADGSGDVAQADTGVTSNADQDMRVIGQKVPVRSRLRRDLFHISGKVF